jgi:hypothetical protein
MSTLQVEVPAQNLAVSLETMKTHLRVSITDDDAYISGLTEAAQEAVEAFTGRSIMIKGYRQCMDSFPYFVDTTMSQLAYPPAYYAMPRYSTTMWNYSQMIKLYAPPLVSVSSITYLGSFDQQFHAMTPIPQIWQPLTRVVPGFLCMDNNGNVQKCTVGGVTTPDPPGWNATKAQLTLEANSTAPVELPIQINNWQFGSPQLETGSGVQSPGAPNGWLLNNSTLGGVFAPTLSQYSNIPSLLDIQGGSTQVGYLLAGGTLRQNTNLQIEQAGDTITLQLLIGSRGDASGLGACTINLMGSDGSTLATYTPTAVPGILKGVSVSYTTQSADVGKYVSILITGTANEIDFTNVSLTDGQLGTGVQWLNMGPATLTGSTGLGIAGAAPNTNVTNPNSQFGTFMFDQDSEPARIFPGPPGALWPAVLYVPNAAQIHFFAGYSNVSDDPLIPGVIRAAIMQIVGGWYENREPYAPGSTAKIPDHVERLLWTKRVMDMVPTRG